MFRKIIISITLGTLFVGFILFSAWNLFELNKEIRHLVISKLKSTFGDDCSIDKLSFGLGSVNLDSVKLVFRDSPYEVKISELRVGYSIKSLLRGGGELEKTAEEITLYKPQLTISYRPNQSPNSDPELSLEISKETENLYRSIIREYDFIKRITISEGEIFIRNTKTSKVTRTAKRINGWAYTDNKDRAWLRLAGHFFESDEYNMVMYGQLDLKKGGVDIVNVDLHDYKLGNEVPFLIPDYFEVLDGVVNGHLTITEQMKPTRGFDIEGNLNLRNGQLKLASENLYVGDVNLDAEINDWDVKLKKSTQIVNGSPVVLSGRIRNLLEPRFDLRLSSNQIDIDEFLTQFLPEKRLPFKGHAGLDVAITDRFSDPDIQGTIKGDSLFFLDRRVHDLTAQMHFNGMSLRISDIDGLIENAKVTGKGKIDFQAADKHLDFGLNIEGDFTNDLHNLGLTSADHCFAKSKTKVIGTLVNPVSRGEVEIRFSKKSTETFLMEGSFGYNQGNFNLNLESDHREDKFRLRVNTHDIFEDPYSNVQADNFQKIFGFVNNRILDFVAATYTLNLTADGIGRRMNFKVEGYGDNFEKVFVIKTDSTWAERTDQLVGIIELFPNSPQSSKGEFELDMTQKGLKLKRIFMDDWLQGSLDLSKDTYTPQKGSLEISGLKLSQLLALLGKTSRNYEGNVYGKIMVNSDRQSPEYSGQGWLLEGFFRDVGPISGELSFNTRGSLLNIKKFKLEKTESTTILAEAQVDLATKEIDATIAGSEVDVNDVTKIIANKDGLIQGDAIVQVGLRGKFPKIPIFGDVKFHNLKVVKFNFDEAIWDFGDSENQNGSYLSKQEVHIGRAVFSKFDEFTLEGSGELGFRGEKQLDLRLSGDGNFLSVLSDIDDVFVNTSSLGHLDLHLSGKYNKPNFLGSRFRCKNGVLQLSSVTKKVENIAADFEVVPEDYFLNIHELGGTIQGDSISISNSNDLTGLNHSVYEPLRVAGDDLNLGALILKTSPNGIPLNIPGLMEKGEVGRFSLHGREKEEAFFVAGPWQRPYVRGKIHVRNVNLVFPFEGGEDSENSVVVNILNNINWDVVAVPGNDTRYVKQFPAGVYVNMEIDKENSQLEFSGVLKDSTFRINGDVQSTRGDFEYVDLNFRVQKFGANFDHSSLYPVLEGKAWTVVRDTSNTPNDVYLELYTVDDITNQEVRQGRWNRVKIKLSSEYPGYEETQADIMETLGYSAETVEEQATKAVGYSTDKFIFRPLMRPLERELEQTLGLDVVRFSYAITRNFLDANFNNEQLSSSLELLRSSRVSLGKYLTDELYFLYTGELKTGIDYQFQDKGVGLQHVLGLEYRIDSKWLLQMEYDYNTLLETHKDDKKIWLRHTFPLGDLD